jgi:hypothetical protein
MTIVSVIGLIILVIGLFLVAFGLKGSQTWTNKVVEGVTGHYTKHTRWLLIGGSILVLIGGILLLVY